MTDRPTELTLAVKAAPGYVVGLPMFVEVTLSNQTEGADYYALTRCDAWSPPFPVEFTFSAGAEHVRLPARAPVSAGATPRGFDLSPGEARTWALDLSELETPVPAGVWQCTARWVMRHEQPRAAAVTVTLTEAESADVPLIQQLRRVGDERRHTWANLVKDPAALQEPALRSLSADARRALLPYLILHEAVHGPVPLSRFPIGDLAHHQAGPWASEAAVLAFELAWARHASDLADERKAVLTRWPGVAFRVEQIERGAGVVTTLRKQYGAERGPTP